MRTYAAVLFILVLLAIPVTSPAVMDDGLRAGPVDTSPELNITGADIANHTIPSRYGIPPTLMDIKVELADTSLPGPKGEMASGPRSIGFATDPVSLALLIAAIGAGAFGVGYLIQRRPQEEAEEDVEDDARGK